MSLQDKHIFIVEDNAANAGIMLTTLQMAGAITHFDRWGRDALHRLRSYEKVDLILMDLMLPNGLTGYDVFHEIRTDAALASIPVVVVSASDANMEMNRARELGFAGYIAKPINFISFPKLIAAILDGHSIWGDDYLS